jgi:hypothetical protein
MRLRIRNLMGSSPLLAPPDMLECPSLSCVSLRCTPLAGAMLAGVWRRCRQGSTFAAVDNGDDRSAGGALFAANDPRGRRGQRGPRFSGDR